MAPHGRRDGGLPGGGDLHDDRDLPRVVLEGPRPQASARSYLRWWMALSVGALTLGGVPSMGLSALAPIRDTPLGSLLAFSSAGLLTVGTVLGVLAGMVRVLEATETEFDQARRADVATWPEARE